MTDLPAPFAAVETWVDTWSDRVYCPVCGRDYIGPEKRRYGAPKCPVCQGRRDLAQQASDQVKQTIQDAWAGRYTLDQVDQMIDRLAQGHHRFAMCRVIVTWRKCVEKGIAWPLPDGINVDTLKLYG